MRSLLTAVLLALLLCSALPARADILPPPVRPEWDSPLPMPPLPTLLALALVLLLMLVAGVVRARR